MAIHPRGIELMAMVARVALDLYEIGCGPCTCIHPMNCSRLLDPAAAWPLEFCCNRADLQNAAAVPSLYFSAGILRPDLP